MTTIKMNTTKYNIIRCHYCLASLVQNVHFLTKSYFTSVFCLNKQTIWHPIASGKWIVAIVVWCRWLWFLLISDIEDKLQNMKNITQFIIEDIDFLKSLLQHEKMFLKFSYYSGFIIASFNFIIFVIASILFAKVGEIKIKSFFNYKDS